MRNWVKVVEDGKLNSVIGKAARLMHHSDRGSRGAFQANLPEYGMDCSMNRCGMVGMAPRLRAGSLVSKTDECMAIVLTRIFYKLTRALACLLIDMKDFVRSGV